MSDNKNALKVGVLSVVLGLIVGLIFAMIFGINFDDGFSTYNPLTILATMLKSVTGIDVFSDSFMPDTRLFGEFLVNSIPIILTGLSVGFAFKTGLFNIGAEGQLLVGGVFALLGGLYLPLPPVIGPIVCVLLGGLGGFLYGVIPGYLKAKFNVHEVVTCIMLNYIALYTNNVVVRIVSGTDKTGLIKPNNSINSSFLESITNGSRLDFSIIIVIIAVIVYWFIMYRTTYGYKLRAIGSNKDGAEYAGMNVNSGIISSMGISGMFAGLAGACVILGLFEYGRVLDGFENIGYNGIAVALVGANAPLGIVGAGGLFGMLTVSQPLLQSEGIPKDIAVIIAAVIIFFTAIATIFDKPIEMFSNRKNKKDKDKGNVENLQKIEQDKVGGEA